jgi:hypothetical protein
MSKQTEKDRCAGCGKKIKEGDKIYRIANGRAAEEGFDEVREWGYLHDDCFLRAVESPKAVLDELRRLAQPMTKAA